MHKLSGWEYRWGDSPAGDNGVPAWAVSDTVGGWLPASTPLNPPGRDGNSMLWLRVTLPDAGAACPSVYFDCVLHAFEAYHRGKLVYRYGTASPRGEMKYGGRPWHIVPLDGDCAGTRLFLRIRSPYSDIGIRGMASFGPYTGHITRIMRDGIWRATAACIFILAGVLALFLFVRRRDDLAVLGAGVSLMTIGIWNAANSEIKLIYLNDPLVWHYAEHASLYIAPVFIGIFLEQIFGKGPYSVIRRGWQFMLVFAIASIGASVIDPYWLRAFTLRPFQVLLALYLIVICVIIGREAWIGDIDARIIASGLAIAVILGLHDIFVSFMGLSFTYYKISYWGMLSFIASLGVVLDRRLRVIPAKIMNFTARRGYHLEAIAGAPEKRERPSALTPEIREKLERALAYMGGHFTENISREGLANLVGMNHDYFGKMFLLHTGRKVSAHISELRVNLAADLLSSSDKNIVDIAFEAGFESLSTFYRIFQTATGLSPMAYRERFPRKQ